jgi:hypothetical protein
VYSVGDVLISAGAVVFAFAATGALAWLRLTPRPRRSPA